MTVTLPPGIPQTRAMQARPIGIRLLVAAAILTLVGTRASAQSVCVGDCDASGQVTVNEIIVLVNMALGAQTQLSACSNGIPPGITDVSQINVSVIIQAVNNALQNSCGDPLQSGLAALAAGDLHSASGGFCQAAAAAPQDNRANLFCTVAGIVAKIVEDPSLLSLARRSGLTITGDSHDVCGLQATVPHDPAAGAPRTGEILTAVRALLLPAIDAAVSNLSSLPATVEIPFNLGKLPSCVGRGLSARDVEIDHGDVLALTATLQTMRAWLDIAAAYNIDIDLASLVRHTPKSVLAAAPALLTLTSATTLGTARQDLTNALANAGASITSVLNETDDQSNDLLVIAPKNRDDATRAVRILDLVRQSLQGQVLLTTDLGLPEPQRLNLSKLFSGQFTTLRSFLPAFTADGQFDVTHFPDPTFGGTAPDLTQLQISQILLGNDCSYYPTASSQAACDAVAAQEQCSSSYFYSSPGYSYCALDGCLCIGD